MLVDNAAMQLIPRPRDFDVILTENMFGDILSDEAAMLAGSLGMLPARQPRAPTGRACSSPSTARRPTSPAQGIANPLAMFLSAAMMLRHGSAGTEAAAARGAVDAVLRWPAHRPTWAARGHDGRGRRGAVLAHL